MVGRFRPGSAPVIALLSLIVVLAGAGNFGYRIAAAPTRSDSTLMARLDGVLAGQANPDGTACFWVGDGTDRTALFWPWHYTSRSSPFAPAVSWTKLGFLSRLTVLDDQGRRAAAVGQRVSFGGGLMPAEVHSIVGCSGFSRYWVVGAVISAR
jgi:hypothetical protein